ncbi:MAG: hypothetical protein ATN33_08070 [Epulopiscium sp. Nele67-Bin001]|nr:MAG: hypothetical protein ATN33_08070 [Epulopiscium sp. Nele67-Bin001]
MAIFNLLQNRHLETALKDVAVSGTKAKSLVDNAQQILNDNVNVVCDQLKDKTADDSALSKQLLDVVNELQRLPTDLLIGANNISKKDFCITLFGKTMSGKSTLVETLIKGSGMNSLRTTKQIQSYRYHNMVITDVPGFGNFNEDLAVEATHKSDLIVFIITDEQPQAKEAAWLDNILKLGKPVICLINAQLPLDECTNIRMFKRDLEDRFDRIDEIKEQFCAFGASVGYEWDNLMFIPIHLKAAFLGHKLKSRELYRVSKIKKFENKLIKEVTKNGTFYKYRSFAEAISAPIGENLSILLKQSNANKMQSTIFRNSETKIECTCKQFEQYGLGRIDAFLARLRNDLICEATEFAQNNYNNTNASDDWIKVVEGHDINEQVNNLFNKLKAELRVQLEEVIKELTIEIDFVHQSFAKFEIPKITPTRSMWGLTFLSGGLNIAAIASSTSTILTSTLVAPLSAAAGIVGIISLIISQLFKNKQRKLAQIRLRDQLYESIQQVIDQLNYDIKWYFENEFLVKSILPVVADLRSVEQSMYDLSNIQFDLSTKLNNQLLKPLNKSIIEKAISHLGLDRFLKDIDEVVRIPGRATLIITKKRPNDLKTVKAKLTKFLKEEIIVASNNVEEVLGVENITEDTRVIYIKEDLNSDPKFLLRVELAKKLTNKLVLNA